MTIRNTSVLATLLAVGLAGAALSAFPWTRDMFDGPVVTPHEQLMSPPEDALTVEGPRILGRRDARDKLTNPLPASAAVLAEGAELYRIYCASCHGADGSGNGRLVEFFDRTGDLRDPDVQDIADGELYNRVREGGFTMPAFANALSVNERWAVIHHVRTYDVNR